MLGTFELPDGVVQADPPVPLETVGIVVLAGGPLFELDDPELFDQPGTYTRESMTFPTPTGTVERTFTYYVPSTHDGTEAMPLVVTLHGAGSYGIGQLAYSDFDRVAEEEGFIVVAPDYGASALGTFTTPGIADFTSAIIDRLSEDFAIDERRVYASGISMGGGASVTLAYGLSDRIAAVAPVASGISRALAEDLPRPTTFVTFYGTQDSGWSPIFFAANERIAELNGASATPEVTTWPATPDDPTTINRYAHTGGVYGTEAVFYQVEEGGHTWPGKYQYASLISVGLTSQQFDATEVIWDHLSRQSLPIEVPVDILPDRINPDGRGLTPVAVLSTDEVDATTLELDVVRLGPGEARPRASSTQDVDGDGRLDIVLRFATQDLGIEPGDTSAALTGRATDGGAVDGSDTFVTAPG
jgi:polyhydroxybutyrate depolymerase